MFLLKLYSRQFLQGYNLCFKQVKYIMSSMMKENELITDFNNFKFSPLKLLDLPIEKNKENYVRGFIKGVIFSYVKPTPLSGPKLVAFSDDALTNILDLDPIVTESQAFVDFVAGNYVLPSSTPLAHRYGGHQFGTWAMQLGDGRAILLGEYINRIGKRWELQLKGSGKTPYSRLGDGRAVLRSSIREFLCSEAMFYLGIPTTRAAALIVSEDKVIRDLLYDGHPKLEPAAVVLRLAPSWFRFGSLEILSKSNEMDEMRKLVDFIIKEHFPDIVDDDKKIINFMQKVIRMSSDLVVQWQSVGFTHGVLNTDNISLLGLTIDYGPFGFMEEYNPRYVPNHSDTEARYCYGNQVQVMLVNIILLGKSISPLLSDEHVILLAQFVEKEFQYANEKFMEIMSQKLGFSNVQEGLVKKLLTLFKTTKADFNMTLRQMSENSFSTLERPDSSLWALKTLSNHEEYSTFIHYYKTRIMESGINDNERMERMCKLNPCYVLRNWMAHQAISKAENGDFSEVKFLLEVLKKPFTRQEEAENMGYSQKPPEWAKTICLSCSS